MKTCNTGPGVNPLYCEEQTNYVREPYQETITTGYNVTGNLGDRNGPMASVQRDRAPNVGSIISVQVRVW